MRKKIYLVALVFIFVAVVLIALATVPRPHNAESNIAEDQVHLSVDELYVRDILNGTKIDDIISNPNWEAITVDVTENYVMVDADKFDFSRKIGVEDGYTNIYYNPDNREVEMLQHNYVTYTNDLEPKKELQNLVGNVQSEITALIGNPSCSFMLMNTTGEMKDYDGLTIDEMIDKLIEGDHVMYVMYENNGLRYEMNIMFSDDTIYSIVWIYDDSHLHSDDCNH